MAIPFSTTEIKKDRKSVIRGSYDPDARSNVESDCTDAIYSSFKGYSVSVGLSTVWYGFTSSVLCITLSFVELQLNGPAECQ